MFEKKVILSFFSNFSIFFLSSEDENFEIREPIIGLKEVYREDSPKVSIKQVQ